MKLRQNGSFKASIGDHLTALARAQQETKDASGSEGAAAGSDGD
jgi:hypothetical protein